MRRPKAWESGVAPKRKKKKTYAKPYQYKEPKPLTMNIYVLDEADVLQMVLKDRRLKER